MAVVRGMSPRIIETENDIRDGVRALRRACQVMRHVHDVAGDPPLRRHKPGFEGLSRIIAGQQLSIASAEAIWRRTVVVVAPFDASTMLALSDDDLRGVGLSRPKIRTLRALAAAVANEGLDIESLARKPEAVVHETLTAIHGIGPWTADIFLLFCAGQADAWAPGDLALQIAAQHALELGSRPTAADLAAIADRWRPWRGVAARLLWTYYAAIRKMAAGQPV